MHIDKTPMRSKIGRRLFALFVLCALVPITLLAAVSLWDVSNQLRVQNRRELRQASHEEGMGIYERLTFLEADLKLIRSSLTSSIEIPSSAINLPSHFDRRFKGLEIRLENGTHKLVFGKIEAEFDLTSEELAHLRSGKSLLSTRSCMGDKTCVFLIESLDTNPSHATFLVGEILPSYLLDAETIPEDKNFCILDQYGRTVVCSGDIPSSFPSNISDSASGQFKWAGNSREYEADYWNVFLKPAFFAKQVTIVASEARDDVLLPLAQFKRIFVLVTLLALLIVLLLTLIQLRRNLVPLGNLQEGTRRIAAGDFQSRVVVGSNDEFDDLGRSFNSMAGRIEKQFNSLTTKSAIDRAILSSWDIDQIVNTLLSGMHLLLHYKIANVSLFQPNAPAEMRSHLSLSRGTVEKDVETTVLSADELKEISKFPEVTSVSISDPCPHFLLPLFSRGMRYFLIAPIFVSAKLSGIVSIGHDEGLVWAEEDNLEMKQIVDQVGVALSNARLLVELKELNWGALTALARTIDAKSPWTLGHSERVTKMALRLAREMNLGERDLDILHRGGLLHDIGKIGIPGNILDKPGKLTDVELAQIQEHVEIGRRILEPIPGFAECMPVVLQHHEWVNGAGYPNGLAGEEITIHARIFAVADCYDALISDRPYRKGLPLDRVFDILHKGVGTQFDPNVMDALLRVTEHEADTVEHRR